MYTLAIHGGAGVIDSNSITADEGKLYKEGLVEALQAGLYLLDQGENALDAVEAAVTILEDNPLFNAGKGSVFNYEGKHEMEASVMWGKTLDAGAVCSLRNVRNPVRLARMVIERSQHVFLNGAGAEEFAKEHGLPLEDDSYFFVTKRYDQLIDAKKNTRIQLDHVAENKYGTVGAVALDRYGNLAAATSTGGLTNKNYGRIGDSPIIGAGTYANNDTCAISCTGNGEFFIRSVAAYDISCLMEYKSFTLKEACELVIMEKMVKMGGEGGVIAADKWGNVELLFNTIGMYRAYATDSIAPQVDVF